VGSTSADKADGIAWSATGPMPAFIEQSRGGWQHKTVKMSPYRTVTKSPAPKNKRELILLE
jgi:hypothetical protein